MGNEGWHYSTGDDHQAGPISAKELNRLAASGELKPDDLVWKEGMPEWTPANRLKGLDFPEPGRNGTQNSPGGIDVEKIQAKFQNFQRSADEVSGTLWFLDLKFQRCVSLTIVRIVWPVYLALALLGFVLATMNLIVEKPLPQVIAISTATLLGFVFLTLMLRMSLEAFVVVFRNSEYLRQMNETIAAK